MLCSGLTLLSDKSLVVVELRPVRTKRWMSDPDYQPKKFLYLPASQAMKVAQAPPGSQQFAVFSLTWTICLKLTVFIHDPVNTESEDNKTLRKYANILRRILRFRLSTCYTFTFPCVFLGQPPFDMAEAADCIDDLANNVFGRYPLLEISRPGFDNKTKTKSKKTVRTGWCPASGLLSDKVSIGNLR